MKKERKKCIKVISNMSRRGGASLEELGITGGLWLFFLRVTSPFFVFREAGNVAKVMENGKTCRKRKKTVKVAEF